MPAATFLESELGLHPTTSVTIDQLPILESFVEVEGLILAEDVVSKSGTVLVKSGQPFRNNYRRYLETHDNYHPEIVFRLDATMMSRFGERMKHDVRILAEKPTGSIVYELLSDIREEIEVLMEEVLQDPRLVACLFDVRLRHDTDEYSVYDHLLTVASLTLAVAATLDKSYLEQPNARNALMSGLLHDVALTPQYATLVESGSILNDTCHARKGANHLQSLGIHPDVVHAVRYHHTFRDGSGPYPNAFTRTKPGFLCDVLTVAEYFTTLTELNPGEEGVEETLFIMGNYGQKDILLNDAVVCLSSAVAKYRNILDTVDAIGRIEKRCPHSSAYAYPKLVHSEPCEVICRENKDDCEFYRLDDCKLKIKVPISDKMLRVGAMNLPAGTYGKCSLGLDLPRYAESVELNPRRA